ncbi:putative uncharacterized protein [Clostridium sp. CAG:448]|nr:putative uncharacterized protein [Clostridium sp. CAG:448]
MRFLGNHIGSQIDILKSDLRRNLNTDQNTSCTFNGRLKQRAGNCHLCGKLRLVLAGCTANTHVGIACILHNGGNVIEVQVDESGHVNQLGNTLHTAAQNIVRTLESIHQRNALIGRFLQFIVRNHNQRINILAQLGNTGFRIGFAHLSFKREGLGHNTDGQNAHLLCTTCNHRRRACSSASAHAGSHKHHVGVVEQFFDVIQRLLRRTFADLRLCACTATAGQLLADHQLFLRIGSAQRLTVRIDGNKFHASDV